MAKVKSQNQKPTGNGTGLNFEAQLWAATTWKLARMNLAIRDFSLSASNESPRSRERERMSAGQVRVVGEKQFNAERFGVRCRIRSSPVNNANYAWIQHFIHHLSPVGVAGFVMAKTTRNAHSCSVKITGDVRKNAAEKGSEVYAKA